MGYNEKLKIKRGDKKMLKSYLVKERDTAILVPEKGMDVIIFKDDDQYIAFCPELDLVTAQDFPEEAVKDMTLAIKEYAEDYMANFDTYSKSPNRKAHLPLIQQIVALKDDWGIKEMIEVRYGDLYLRPVQKGS
jgi:predicted RNase H-like HicB family nuclease